jgi:phosphate transport system substrate-binding protein
MRLLAKSYCSLHPEVAIEVLPSLGTSGGSRAVKAGAIDLAVASRSLTEKEQAGVKSHFLGKSPFVFAVHPETRIADVTLSQVARIYDGSMANWRDGSRIRRILRPVDDADWQYMRTLSPELARALDVAQSTNGLQLSITDTDAVDYLERTEGSFGPTTLAMVLAEKRKVKVLSFEGRQPGNSEPGGQPYPLMKSYLLLTSSKSSPEIEGFIDFIHSDSGREILAQVGIIPGGDQPQ